MSSTGQQVRPNDSRAAGRVQPTGTRPGETKPTAPKVPPGRTWLWLLAVLLANYLMMRLLFPSADAPITVPYTLFKEQVAKRNVEAIYSQGVSLTGRFREPVTYPPEEQKSSGSRDQT